MFGNLIESGSHAADLKRRGRFFVGASVFYALLIGVAGVGSIYAYNTNLGDESESLEVYAIMRFPPSEARTEPARRAPARAAAGQTRENLIASRIEISNVTPYRSDNIASARAKDINPRTPVVLGNTNIDPPSIGGEVGPNRSPGGSRGDGPTVPVAEVGVPPPPSTRPTPPPAVRAKPDGPVRLPSAVINGKSVHMPTPAYPQMAKAAGVQGAVGVQLVIDERGNVISAKATSGHPLLQAAAVQAARQARFSPTLLGGSPVKVTGVITYNFVLR